MSKSLNLDALRDNPAPIMDVFFNAMLAGYVTRESRSTVIDLPGSKFIEYHKEWPWLVSDIYVTNTTSHYSRGMTLIYYDGVPVWSMGYIGQYPPTAIPVLKAALSAAYGSRKFFGGRGPKEFKSPDGRYLNLKMKGNFRNFSGREHVFTSDDRYGSHTYEGGLMI